MGIFSGIGSIVGGIKGSNAQAPEIFDEFKPGKVFDGLSAGGRLFRLRDGRLVVTKGKRALKSRRQIERVIGKTRRFGRQLHKERRRLGKQRRGLLSLQSEVRPGFGRLTDARVRAIDRGREQATGNLREQFGARNLLGSTFALREESGLVAEFAEREEEARAQGIIDEIGATLGIDQTLLQVAAGQRAVLAGKLQAIQVRLGAVQTKIQTDLAEAGLAANIQQNVLQIAERIARAQAGLEAQAAADRGAATSGIFSGLDEVFGGVASLGGAFGGGAGLTGAARGAGGGVGAGNLGTIPGIN